MVFEPVRGQTRDLLECTRFFEQVRCTRHDFKGLLAVELRKRRSIQRQDFAIVPAHDQKRGCPDLAEHGAGEVGPTTPGYDRADRPLLSGCRDQCRRRTRARTEIAETQRIAKAHLVEPTRGELEALGEKLDVEHVAPVASLCGSQEIEKQSSQPPLSQRLRDSHIAGASVAAAAAVREEHERVDPVRDLQSPRQVEGRNADRFSDPPACEVALQSTRPLLQVSGLPVPDHSSTLRVRL